MLFGAIVLFDLRLLGLARSLSVVDLAKYLLPAAYWGFGIAAISGLLLFIAHAREVGANAVFLFKLLLIGAAGCNAVIFHQGVFQSVDRWHDKPVVPRSAKTTAVISLLLWLAIICCGRLIAYT